MSDTITIDGLAVTITDPDLGVGGQGAAQKGHLAGDMTTEVVAKAMQGSETRRIRSEAIVAKQLPLLSRFLAGPLACVQEADGTIRHIAPFVEGANLENDRPRTFPELLGIAHHLSCHWTVCEENGVDHGDIALTNVMVSDEGEAYLIDFDSAHLDDPAVPPPDMAGQHMMLAPEIRARQCGPNRETDRFAWPVLFSTMLLGRHPASQATTPAELDTIMTTGDWPERIYSPGSDETLIEALGCDLPQLFDQGFSLDPFARPSADKWRRAFHVALNSIWIHDCGQAFVGDERVKACPWCGQAINIAPAMHVLTLRIPASGSKFKTPLKDGVTITLGRGNLGVANQAVSGRHLEITRHRDQLLLRHVGRNPTTIQMNGQWWRLRETWIDVADLSGSGIAVKLADCEVVLST